MPKNISELDQSAMLMKASWRKANNYFVTFAKAYLEIKKRLDAGEFGSEWTSTTWVFAKVGVSEKIAVERMMIFKNSIAAEDREKLQAVQAEQAAAKKAAAEEKKAAKVATDAEKAAAKKAKATAAKKAKKAAAAKKGHATRKAKAAAISPDKLTQLGAKLREGQERAKQITYDWIENTLYLAKYMAEARTLFHTDIAFGEWLTKEQITIGKTDRAAYINMGKNLELTNTVLQKTHYRSPRRIWDEEIAPQTTVRAFAT